MLAYPQQGTCVMALMALIILRRLQGFLENLYTPELVHKLLYLYINFNRVCTFVYEDLLRFCYLSGNIYPVETVVTYSCGQEAVCNTQRSILSLHVTNINKVFTNFMTCEE
jgi:hypothetical protein